MDVYERNKYFYSKCHSHFITPNGLKYRKFVISYKAFKPERIFSKAFGWNLAAISKVKMKIENRQLSQSLLCISTSKKALHTQFSCQNHLLEFWKRRIRGEIFLIKQTILHLNKVLFSHINISSLLIHSSINHYKKKIGCFLTNFHFNDINYDFTMCLCI